MTVEQSVYPSRFIAGGRVRGRVSGFSRPMDCLGWPQLVGSLRLVALGHVGGICRGVVVHTRCCEAQAPEDQRVKGGGKGQLCLFLDDESKKIVSRVLFTEELRAGFKKQRLSLDSPDQSGGCLML